jgi:hypothetical protein
MQEKFSIVAIAAVITAVFTTTLVLILTVQSANAVCARNGVCATTTPNPPSSVLDGHIGASTALGGGGPNAVNSGGQHGAFTSQDSICGGKPFVMISPGHILCLG